MPSVLILLLAAAVIFFLLPRFGAPVLALISVGLLAFGIYQHINAFGNEYRFSTWQQGLVNYAPYVMIGGLLVVVAFYLLTISPLGRPNTTAPNMPEMPSVTEMPAANTATNAVTAGVNNALKGIGAAAAAVGLNGSNKKNEKTGEPTANGAAQAMNKAATGAANAMANVTKGVNDTLKGLGNAMKNVLPGGNAAKPNNKGGLAAALGLGAPAGNGRANANKGLKVPGVPFPLSQV